MSSEVPILMYHSISSGPATPRYRPYVVSPRVFAAQMRLLRERGYNTLTVSQLVDCWASGRLPVRPVVVTFDDALADFYTDALPVMLEHGVTGTLYVPTAFIGARSHWLEASGEGMRAMMSWSQLREATAHGIECGAHSHHHLELDVQPAKAAWNEIRTSRWALEDGLGRSIASFAYPYGKHSGAVRDLVRRAGFSSACAVGNALASADADDFAIARVTVIPTVTLSQFAKWLDGRDLRPAPRREAVRTTLWRVVRRVRHQLAPSAAAFGASLPAVAGIV